MMFCSGFKRVNKAKLAIGWYFFSTGAIFGNWAGVLPTVQSNQDISNPVLGGILVMAVGGAILGLPIVTYLANKYGSKISLFLGAVIFCGSYPLVGIARLDIFCIAVFLMGVGAGWVDTSMNAQAVVCEKMVRLPTLGLFHSIYGIGGLVGALSGGLFLQYNFTVIQQSFIFAYMLLAIQILWFCWLFSPQEEKLIDQQTSTTLQHEYTHTNSTTSISIEEPLLSPSRSKSTTKSIVSNPSLNEENKQIDWQVYESPVIVSVNHFMIAVVCILCFLSYLGQGSIGDWSAIYLYTELNTSSFISTLGFAGFELFIAIGAYGSDYFVMLLGRRKVLQLSGVIAALGLGLVVIAPGLSSSKTIQIVCTIIGFSLSGIGMSVVPPSVISIAGSGVLGLPSADAIAIVSSIGYLGVMVGPPLLGGLSALLGQLRWSFAVDGILMLLMTLLACITQVGIARIPKDYDVERQRQGSMIRREAEEEGEDEERIGMLAATTSQ